jgi:hypothetical protein
MLDMHPSLIDIPMPARIRRLPLDHRHFPVPFFVAWINCQADHRVVGEGKVVEAYNKKRCWICGEPLGRFLAFLVGPMCTVSRTVPEPPSHRECAEYAAQACPFLARPYAHRREAGLPADKHDAAGIPLDRNPGVVCLWITRSFAPFKAYKGNAGILFRLGTPVETLWYCEGRTATREDVLASMESGLPLLRAQCRERNELAALEMATARAMTLIPAI